MDNPRLFEQLDNLIEALVVASTGSSRWNGDYDPVIVTKTADDKLFTSVDLEPEAAELAYAARELLSLPREDFKTRLKADLERRAKMASPATQASTSTTQRTTHESLPRPEGYRTITPYLTVQNAEQLLDFVRQTFRATVLEEVKGPAGRLHAEVRIGDSPLMMGSSPSGPWFPTSLHVRVDKVDEVYERAVAAGAKSVHGPQEMEYGERAATVIDACGNNWYLATPNAKTHWLPEMSDVTVYLHPRSSDALFDFAKRAFGAEEIERHAGGGVVHHAKIRVGDSVLEMGDAHGDHDSMPTMFYLYVPDVDAAYDRAVGAGATSVDAPAAMPYGDYVGSVADPFGNRWYMAAPTRAHRPERAAQQHPSAPVASSSTEPSKVSYIRPGFRTLTPYLLVDGAAQEIEFLKNGLGATEKFRVPAGERIMHAQMQIGDAVVELADANAQFPARAMMNILYVPDPDAAYARSLAGGGTSMYPVSTKPWGDRDGVVVSPGGVIWCLSNRGAGEHITADTPSLVPGFIVKDAVGYIEFMKRAFGAEEMFSHKAPDGTVIHSRVRIGNSVLGGGELVSGGPHERKEVPFLMHVYVPDVDAVYANALAAGATTVRDLEDAPYGDRTASVADPYGNLWSLATHIRDVRF
jgi:PhnB protein